MRKKNKYEIKKKTVVLTNIDVIRSRLVRSLQSLVWMWIQIYRVRNPRKEQTVY